MNLENAVKVSCVAMASVAVEKGNYGFLVDGGQDFAMLAALRELAPATAEIVVVGYESDWYESDGGRLPDWVARFEDSIIRSGSRVELSKDSLLDERLGGFWQEPNFYAHPAPGQISGELVSPGVPLLSIDLNRMDVGRVARHGVFFSTATGLFSGPLRSAVRRHLKKRIHEASDSEIFVPLLTTNSVRFLGSDGALRRLVDSFFSLIGSEGELRDHVPGNWVDRLLAADSVEPSDLLTG